MNLSDYKKKVQKQFLENGIDSSEVNILFCEALNLSRAELLQKNDLQQIEKIKIERAVKKRLAGMPIQKIFKRAYFYGYTFYVNKNVLCPRPETELLVEECLKFAKKDDKILDLCTGSGCIAVAIKKNINAKVYASDISQKALYVAKKNAKNLNENIKFFQSNLFEKINQKFDIIVSNPPYIPTCEIENLDIEVKEHDPKISLDGGEDGLEFYRHIAIDAKNHLNKNGKILLEIGIKQAKNVQKLLKNAGFSVYSKKDYNNIERVVVGELL